MDVDGSLNVSKWFTEFNVNELINFLALEVASCNLSKQIQFIFYNLIQFYLLTYFIVYLLFNAFIDLLKFI